jgi:hypothetical protein
MIKIIGGLIIFGVLFSGCAYYQPAPAVYVTKPANSFDRSWNAAVGALQDQGVRIATQDRSSGIVRGSRNGIDATANVRTQADSSVRVEFNTSGATANDPELINRITQSYNRRMGR